jgi:hypothetical protein
MAADLEEAYKKLAENNGVHEGMSDVPIVSDQPHQNASKKLSKRALGKAHMQPTDASPEDIAAASAAARLEPGWEERAAHIRRSAKFGNWYYTQACATHVTNPDTPRDVLEQMSVNDPAMSKALELRDRARSMLKSRLDYRVAGTTPVDTSKMSAEEINDAILRSEDGATSCAAVGDPRASESAVERFAHVAAVTSSRSALKAVAYAPKSNKTALDEVISSQKLDAEDVEYVKKRIEGTHASESSRRKKGRDNGSNHSFFRGATGYSVFGVYH